MAAAAFNANAQSKVQDTYTLDMLSEFENKMHPVPLDAKPLESKIHPKPQFLVSARIRKEFASRDPSIYISCQPRSSLVLVLTSKSELCASIRQFFVTFSQSLQAVPEPPKSTRVRLFLSGVGFLHRTQLNSIVSKFGDVRHLAMRDRNNPEKHPSFGPTAFLTILVPEGKSFPGTIHGMVGDFPYVISAELLNDQEGPKPKSRRNNNNQRQNHGGNGRGNQERKDRHRGPGLVPKDLSLVQIRQELAEKKKKKAEDDRRVLEEKKQKEGLGGEAGDIIEEPQPIVSLPLDVAEWKIVLRNPKRHLNLVLGSTCDRCRPLPCLCTFRLPPIPENNSNRFHLLRLGGDGDAASLAAPDVAASWAARGDGRRSRGFSDDSEGSDDDGDVSDSFPDSQDGAPEFEIPSSANAAVVDSPECGALESLGGDASGPDVSSGDSSGTPAAQHSLEPARKKRNTNSSPRTSNPTPLPVNGQLSPQ